MFTTVQWSDSLSLAVLVSKLLHLAVQKANKARQQINTHKWKEYKQTTTRNKKKTCGGGDQPALQELSRWVPPLTAHQPGQYKIHAICLMTNIGTYARTSGNHVHMFFSTNLSINIPKSRFLVCYLNNAKVYLQLTCAHGSCTQRIRVRLFQRADLKGDQLQEHSRRSKMCQKRHTWRTANPAPIPMM